MSIETAASERQNHQNRWIFDHLAVAWLVLGFPAGISIAYREVIPSVFGKSRGWTWFNYCFLGYGSCMLLVNWLLMHFTSNKVTETATISTSDNPICAHCNIRIPLRAHHCNLCKTCVLKHNHHCFFAATCIGFRNHRYFMTFVFWMFIGCSYSFCVASTYLLSERWIGVGWYCYPFFPIAILKYMFGYISWFSLVCTLLYISLCAALFGSSFLFFQQLYLIGSGQTAFEYKNKRKSPVSHLPVSMQLRVVFGPLWLLQLLLPIGIFAQPMGDGVHWDSLKAE